MDGRNRISRKAAKFGAAADRAERAIKFALTYYRAFIFDGSERDAEFARQQAHDAVDAHCDAIRAVAKVMGSA